MKASRKSGFSLVEVMVAALILAFLILGSAHLLYQTGSGIQSSGNRRVALERARTQLESLRAADYMALRNRAIAGNPEILAYSETLNGVPISITATNRLVISGGILDTVSGGSKDNEYIDLSVRASYGSANDPVFLHTTKTISP